MLRQSKSFRRFQNAHRLLTYHFHNRIWGLAAINAYRAYKDPQSLQFAESTWDYMSQYLVTADDATSGTLSTKNATFPSTCHGGEYCPCNRYDTIVQTEN